MNYRMRFAKFTNFEIITSGPYATNWYPSELGNPSSSGSQNNIRYGYFPQTRRLAIDYNGSVTIYDTLDHNIGGVSQQIGRRLFL